LKKTCVAPPAIKEVPDSIDCSPAQVASIFWDCTSSSDFQLFLQNPSLAADIPSARIRTGLSKSKNCTQQAALF
jgi:hypothetical protein